MDAITDIFREEAREHLTALEAGLLFLENAPAGAAQRPQVDELFRHAHSLKGDARAVGLDQLQQAASRLEELLDRFRDAPEALRRPDIDEGLQRLDKVRAAYQAWENSLPRITATPPMEPIVHPVAAVTTAAPAEPPPAASEPVSTAGENGTGRSGAAGSETGDSFTVRVTSSRLDQLLNSVGEARIAQRSAQLLVGRLRELRQQVEEQKSPRAAAEPHWDALIEQLRQLETEARVQQNRQQLSLESLEHSIREARLLPLSSLAESLRRTVRDLAHSLGKEIRYVVDVGAVRLDKGVIEGLRSPLMHLISNACDHGVESREARRSTGKPEAATIKVTARQRGPHVELTVSDDGAGLDLQRIRERLLAQRKATAPELDDWSDDDLGDAIFEAGMTTAALGAISGRGVGLDVVRHEVQRLQGRVSVRSRAGEGAAFTLILPVTLSQIRIVSVWQGGQLLGVPSASILGLGRAARSEIRVIEGAQVVSLQGRTVRWLVLSDLLGSTRPRGVASQELRPYLLLEFSGELTALAVDDFEEEHEVLLKPLGFPLAQLPSVLGGAIRPDGSVQLVLDPTHWKLGGGGAAEPAAQLKQTAARMLVVDDSPTTRALLQTILVAAGYVVHLAVDGIDALEKLQALPYDLVVSDFEMPRLSGVDLTRQIKSRYGYPVILVTGRESPEHRREGLEVGADAYLDKSTFRGESLLEVVRQLL